MFLILYLYIMVFIAVKYIDDVQSRSRECCGAGFMTLICIMQIRQKFHGPLGVYSYTTTIFQRDSRERINGVRLPSTGTFIQREAHIVDSRSLENEEWRSCGKTIEGERMLF
jgi:hypothetical protein